MTKQLANEDRTLSSTVPSTLQVQKLFVFRTPTIVYRTIVGEPSHPHAEATTRLRAKICRHRNPPVFDGPLTSVKLLRRGASPVAGTGESRGNN
jgi:hypothetical protein